VHPLQHSDTDTLRSILLRSELTSAGCLEFTGSKNRQGYGNVRYQLNWEKVHRVIFDQLCGGIPAGGHVLHRCDNPACFKPSHLFIGTNGENHADKARKGRGGKGLTIEKVQEMRRLWSSGIPQKELQEMFKVAQSTVSRVVAGKRRTHVAFEPKE